MKKRFIVANWKSNKTLAEANDWLHHISASPFPITDEREVILCPPFTLLSMIKNALDEKKLILKLGAQDISPFTQGAYTGEVNALQIKEFAAYVIIGHSERREHFSETDEQLAKKVDQALSAGLQPIFCIQSAQTAIPDSVTIVAYEPVEAIGSGHPDTPADAETVSQIVKKNHTNVQVVLYGGSVTAENVNSFTQSDAIDGVLVGGASLDAEQLSKIIGNA